jgi:hypothetical protein
LGTHESTAADGVPLVSVDSFVRRHEIAHLHILHVDTQGVELDILRGARQTISERQIDYIFISTHTNYLHLQCLRELQRSAYVVLADIDLLETFSHDGLIVARRRELAGPEPFVLSSK